MRNQAPVAKGASDESFWGNDAREPEEKRIGGLFTGSLCWLRRGDRDAPALDQGSWRETA